MIGKIVSQYRILEKIGEGGMGTVYLAHDTELDRRVALKFLPERLLSDAQALARFKREAQSIAALDHPNIITIYEIGRHEGVPFIAMPYVEGEVLSDVIARGPLPIDRAVDIILQVCAGLDRAHAADIIHRDIKPGNIMIDKNGLVKILDFGLAIMGTDTRITADYSALGTVHYMSPEQARGRRVDGRSDIFSLGAVFYETLTGRPAFEGDVPAAILYAIEHAQPPELTASRKDVPSDLEHVIGRMLAKDPAERYATAGDVAVDLPAVGHGTPAGSGMWRPLGLGTRPPTGSGVRVQTGEGMHGPTTGVRSAERWWGRRGWAIPIGAAVLLILAAGVFGLRSLLVPARSDAPGSPRGERTMIAVLPFENLGTPAEDYFADGITEEINTRLAAVPDLGVISRTSTLQYKGSKKTTKDIGGELGVDYILEGTIRWDRSIGGNRVLITPQLIRVSDDTYVWSERYDRVLDDIFRTQSEIAAQVIGKLNIALAAPAREVIESRPTDNLEAYHAYLYGLEAASAADYSEEQAVLGIRMFERAVALDPDFAQAHAELSRLHSRTYHLGIDRTPHRLALAEAEADRALALAPALVQTRLALAYYYYWGFKDYDKALNELDAAGDHNTHDARILEARGYILRRQGKYEESAESLERAFELSPRDAALALEVANTLLGMWRFDRARDFYELAISLAPDRVEPYTLEVRNQLLWDGDLAAARAILDRMPQSDAIRAVWFRAFQEFFERNYQAVIDQLSDRRGDTYQTHAQVVPLSLTMAWAYEGLGDTLNARIAYEEAGSTLEKELEAQPEDFRVLMALGLVYAGLGHRDDAIRYGNQAVDIYPMSKDAWAGPIVQRNMIFLLARAGETDAAMEKMDYLLSFPNPGASPSLFRIEPRLDALRGDPRFSNILEARSAGHS
ncbi:MAG: protein kinase [bacterium]